MCHLLRFLLPRLLFLGTLHLPKWNSLVGLCTIVMVSFATRAARSIDSAASLRTVLLLPPVARFLEAGSPTVADPKAPSLSGLVSGLPAGWGGEQ